MTGVSIDGLVCAPLSLAACAVDRLRGVVVMVRCEPSAASGPRDVPTVTTINPAALAMSGVSKSIPPIVRANSPGASGTRHTICGPGSAATTNSAPSRHHPRELLAGTPKARSPTHRYVMFGGTEDGIWSPWHSRKLATALQSATAADSPILIRVIPRLGHAVGEPEAVAALAREALPFIMRLLQMNPDGPEVQKSQPRCATSASRWRHPSRQAATERS